MFFTRQSAAEEEAGNGGRRIATETETLRTVKKTPQHTEIYTEFSIRRCILFGLVLFKNTETSKTNTLRPSGAMAKENFAENLSDEWDYKKNKPFLYSSWFLTRLDWLLTHNNQSVAEGQIHKIYAHFEKGISRNITGVLCWFNVDRNSRDGENKSQRNRSYFTVIAEADCRTCRDRIVFRGRRNRSGWILFWIRTSER